MPGSYGFTGQRADTVTGLDYYGARYYDPVAGQFVSADTILSGDGTDPWGLSRYAYVEGDPITRGDPSGHRMDDGGLLYQAKDYADLADKAVDLGQGMGRTAGAYDRYQAWKTMRDYNAEIRALKHDYKVNIWGRRTIPKAVRRAMRDERNEQMRRAHDMADEFEDDGRVGRFLKVLGRGVAIAGAVLDAGVAGINQRNNDAGYDTGMRVTRAITAGVVHGVGTYVVAAAGAEIGEEVGTVAGGLLLGTAADLIFGPEAAPVGVYFGEAIGATAGALMAPTSPHR